MDLYMTFIFISQKNKYLNAITKITIIADLVPDNKTDNNPKAKATSDIIFDCVIEIIIPTNRQTKMAVIVAAPTLVPTLNNPSFNSTF